MARKLICIFVSILVLSITVCEIKTIEGKPDTSGVVSSIHRAYASIQGSFNGEKDLIVDIIQEITEPLYLSYLEKIVAFGTRVTGTTSCYNTGT